MRSGTCGAPMATRHEASRAVGRGRGHTQTGAQEGARYVCGQERRGDQTASHARGHWFKSSTAHHEKARLGRKKHPSGDRGARLLTAGCLALLAHPAGRVHGAAERPAAIP